MSEIFNAYAELALEKEIITKEAQDSEKKEESKEISTTEALYGIKPNGKLDETHIIEQAHPESVVIAPAYDRVNGLVENLLERQDIMAWIALKPNDGKLLQRRYVKAKDDLLNELIRVATFLDMSKKDADLMKLADACSGQIAKEAALPAFLGAVWFWKLIAGATVGASLYGAASNSMSMSHGVMEDVKKTQSEFEDLFEEYPTARKEFSVAMDKLNAVKGYAKNVASMAASIRDLLDAVSKSKEGLEAGIEFLNGKYDEGFVAYLESYKERAKDLVNDIPDYKAAVSGVPKRYERQTEWYEPEFESPLWDPLKWLKRKTVGYDPDEVNQAFDSLAKSLMEEEVYLDKMIGDYEKLRSAVEGAKQDPEGALQQLKSKKEESGPEDISDLQRFMEQQRASEGVEV